MNNDPHQYAKTPEQIAQSLELLLQNSDYLTAIANKSSWMFTENCDKRLQHYARLIEPLDRVLGQDEEMPRANAFYTGELVGRYISSAAFPHVAQSEMFKHIVSDEVKPLQNIDERQDDDILQTIHENAESMLDNGQRGYAIVPESYNNILEKIANIVDVDPVNQRSFYAGVGLIYGATSRAHETKELEKFRKEVEAQGDDGHNWDLELYGLLNGN